jgi:tRNA-dihydrouridine synthase B
MLPHFRSPVFLAPMAGVTTVAFRILCQRFGAGLTGTEFISARGILYDNAQTMRLIDVSHDERPVFIQLFGNDAPSLTRALEIVEPRCDFVDLNMGCPSTKIYDSGCGSALLAEPHKVKEIVSALVSVASKPVTVKIRTGLHEKAITAVSIARICENAGASLITVHGRTRAQGYAGAANWDHIKAVKEAVSIPVAGNGDVSSGASALRMLQSTGCDYVTVGRAALGDPHIFSRINHYLRTGEELAPLALPEKMALLREYVSLCSRFQMDSVSHLKVATQQFLKGFSGAAQLRGRIGCLQTQDEILSALPC